MLRSCVVNSTISDQVVDQTSYLDEYVQTAGVLQAHYTGFPTFSNTLPRWLANALIILTHTTLLFKGLF